MTAFWVAPESRGQGIAEAMVAFVAEWASAQGAAVLEAGVVEDNHRAIAFYKKVGFAEIGRSHPFRGASLKQIILLAKRLTPEDCASEAWD